MTASTPNNPQIWPDFCAEPALIMASRKLIGRDSKAFTMGSCFAAEVRDALTRAGIAVYPDYLGIPFDPKRVIFNFLPQRRHIEHYDTFVIRQEFESALGLWTDRSGGYWEIHGKPANQQLNSATIFQEPCRKLVYAATRDELTDLTRRVDAAIREGIEKADVLVITLGLTEVWRHNKTGRYLCRPPNPHYGGRPEEVSFHQSTYPENYANMKKVLDLLFERYPDKQVVLTVSPVPLEATHSPGDVATANTESKAILRAVAGAISREYASNVTYFPSYEMATAMPGPVFMEDRRHILPEFADRVVSAFMQAFS